jgi:hypothetical protein
MKSHGAADPVADQPAVLCSRVVCHRARPTSLAHRAAVRIRVRVRERKAHRRQQEGKGRRMGPKRVQARPRTDRTSGCEGVRLSLDSPRQRRNDAARIHKN